MLGIMLRKLVSKKWMFACLLLGCTLLIATVVSFPLYRNAAFDKMLHDEFYAERTRTGMWPAKIEMTDLSMGRTESHTIYELEEVMNNTPSLLGLVTKESIAFYRLNTYQMNSLMSRDDIRANLRLRVASMTDFPEHVELLGGEMYSDTGIDEDGVVEAVISQTCMTTYGLLLGETFQFNSVKDPDGNKIKVRIVGIIDEVEGDYYWDIGTFKLNTELIINEKLFRDYFIERNSDNDINCKYCYLFEYEAMTSDDVDHLMSALAKNADMYQKSSFGGVIEEFYNKKERISMTLFILQVPVLVLLGAFLFMMIPIMTPLNANFLHVIMTLAGGALFAVGLGAVSNVILNKTSLV